jgi:hypothetical protein
MKRLFILPFLIYLISLSFIGCLKVKEGDSNQSMEREKIEVEISLKSGEDIEGAFFYKHNVEDTSATQTEVYAFGKILNDDGVSKTVSMDIVCQELPYLKREDVCRIRP